MGDARSSQESAAGPTLLAEGYVLYYQLHARFKGPYLRQEKRYDARRGKLVNTGNRLRAWDEWNRKRRSTLGRFMLSKLGMPREPQKPELEELKFLMKEVLPSTKDVHISICDFMWHDAPEGENSTHSVSVRSVPLGTVQTCGLYPGPGF